MTKTLFQICGFEGQWICLAKLPEPNGDERHIMLRPDTNQVIIVKPMPRERLRMTAGPFTTQEIEDAARAAVFGEALTPFNAIKSALGYFMSQVALKQGLDLTD